MVMFQRYNSSSGTLKVRVTRPHCSLYPNCTSSVLTMILFGRDDEYAPNRPHPQTFMPTVALPSDSYFNSLMAPPELNILIRPMGANVVPVDNSLRGVTVKTSYSRDCNVIGIDAFFGR